MHLATAEMCFNKAPPLYKPCCLSAPALSPGREEDGCQISFCYSNRSQKGRIDFQSLGSCSSLVSISSKKSSLINLSSGKMCDALRAKPLMSKDGVGLKAPGSGGESAVVSRRINTSRHTGLLKMLFAWKNLFHPSVLSGPLPGKGSLLLSLFKWHDQGYRARKG